MSPEELVRRIRDFPEEVRLQQNTAHAKPIHGQVIDYNVAQNLPSKIDFHPEMRAYWVLSELAKLKQILQGELGLVQGIEARGGIYEPSVRLWARDRRPYLDFAIDEVDRLGNLLIASPTLADAVANSKLTSFASVKSEKNNIDCPLLDVNVQYVRDCLLGSERFNPQSPWEGMSIRQFRIIAGEHRVTYGLPPAWTGQHHVNVCAGGDVKKAAQDICGFASNPKTIVDVVAMAGSVSGNNCGYSSYSVTCITPGKTEGDFLPQSSGINILSARLAVKEQSPGQPNSINITKDSKNPTQWNVKFSFNMENCLKSRGQYEFTLIASDETGRQRSVEWRDFWSVNNSVVVASESNVPIAGANSVRIDGPIRFPTALCEQ